MLAFDQGDLAATATEHDAEAPGRRRIRTMVLRGTGVRDRARPGTADRRRSGPTRFGSSRAHSRPARCASGPTTSFLARPIVSWRSLAVLGLRERQAGRVQRQSGAPRRRAARLCQPRLQRSWSTRPGKQRSSRWAEIRPQLRRVAVWLVRDRASPLGRVRDRHLGWEGTGRHRTSVRMSDA